jgi:hypothetical protein
MSQPKKSENGKAAKPLQFKTTAFNNEGKAVPLSSSLPAKSRRNRHLKRWAVSITLLLIALFAGIYIGITLVANWFDQNRIVSQSMVEIKLHSPFRIEPREMISPVATATVSALIPKIEVAQAAEPSPVPIVNEKLTISARGIDCINKNPGIAGKIKTAFGDEWQMASELICRESSFNPQAINKSSGACGLAQALPCAKMKCELSDVECQLTWIGNYVDNRYGSFENAVKFHDQKGWY